MRDAPADEPTISAIIVPCSSRKTVVASAAESAVSLPRSPQRDLETTWLERLRSAVPVTAASSLYAGRGAALARQAATATGARLYVASAGLGLVEAGRDVPAYDVTVSGRGSSALARKVVGSFDPAAWWAAVAGAPTSTPIDLALSPGHGQVALVALTRPYAEMVGSDLARLPASTRSRLRILGWGLDRVLPPELTPSIMPYDARLEVIMPGTRSDFAQRALLHFATRVATAPAAQRAHAEAVEAALSPHAAPVRRVRPRRTDAQIADWIVDARRTRAGVGSLLRSLRAEGVACEQGRFSRIYGQVISDEGRAAA